MTLWVALVVITADMWALPRGLMIRTLRLGVEIPRSPGIEPLLVHVDATGILIDSERMTLDGLRSRLKQELSRRPPDWPVYVVGDPDLEWRSVAEAIDAIRGAHAAVVLLPLSRKPITRL